MAEKMAKKYGLDFLYRDFRVGFREGQAKARELGLYMQKYCITKKTLIKVIYALYRNMGISR